MDKYKCLGLVNVTKHRTILLIPWHIRKPSHETLIGTHNFSDK